MDRFDLCPGAAPPVQPRRLLQGRFNRTGIGNRLVRRAACLFTHLLFLFLLQSFVGNQTRGRQICSPAGRPEPRRPGPWLALACFRKDPTNGSELDVLTPAGEDIDPPLVAGAKRHTPTSQKPTFGSTEMFVSPKNGQRCLKGIFQTLFRFRMFLNIQVVVFCRIRTVKTSFVCTNRSSCC